MRFQPGAVEFGEVAFEIVGNLKTFDLPCAVFQRQNREMGMAADSIKRKPKGTGIQVCFFGIFSLLLLVAVPAEQDCGIEIFQMGQQKLRMQTEIPTEFSGRAVTETEQKQESAGLIHLFFRPEHRLSADVRKIPDPVR